MKQRSKWAVCAAVLAAVLLPLCAVAQTASPVYAGIDVSVFQGDIDFARVKAAGVELVYIRAGEGTTITDSNFEQNYERARAAALDFGFYYYVTAESVADAQAQAERFAGLLEGKSYALRPAMDFESFGALTPAEINTVGLAFLERLAALTGVTPVIYTDAYNAQNLWDERFAAYPVWIADYSSGDEPPANPIWGSDWSGYQYSDAGQVDGITGAVDLDRFRDGVRIAAPEPPDTGERAVEMLLVSLILLVSLAAVWLLLTRGDRAK